MATNSARSHDRGRRGSSQRPRVEPPAQRPIQMTGMLRVKWIEGRNGSFPLGEIFTPIALYKVREPILEQLRDGDYAATFWVQEIYQYAWPGKDGRTVVDLRAALHDLALADHSPLDSFEEGPLELDPVDEPPPVPKQDPPAKSAQKDRGKPAPPVTGSDSKASGRRADDEDLKLFGAEIYELVAAGLPVKLDRTVDRQTLRVQSQRLSKIGYEFDYRSQTYSLRKN